MNNEADFSLSLNADEALELHHELGDLSKDLGTRYLTLPDGLSTLYMELSRRVFDLHRASLRNSLSGASSAVVGDARPQ